MKLILIAAFVTGALCAFPARADVDTSFPVLVNPTVTAYNGQIFGRQICPIENFNGADVAAVQANRLKYGLVKRVVLCVKGLVLPAVYQIMFAYSVNYFYGPVTAACTLAVMFWGIMMAMGKRSAPMRDAFIVALKVGAVSMFTFVLGKSDIFPDGVFPLMIGVVDDLARIVTSYIGYSSTVSCDASVAGDDLWGRLDCIINTLVGGIFNSQLLMAGLLGFFVSAIFSGTIGLFIALAGFAVIFFLLMSVLRAVYIVITAYIALALMALVSPIFITMLLFGATRGFFDKWLRATMGFMLQPLFVFAYLAMLLAVFDTVVYDGRYSIYRAIAPISATGLYPEPLRSYGPTGDFSIGNYLFDQGVYQVAEGISTGVGTNPRLNDFVKSTNVGILGNIGTTSVPDSAFNQTSGGMGLSVIDSLASQNVFRIGIDFKKILWKQLAFAKTCTEPGCTATYMENQLLFNYCPDPTSCTEDQIARFRARSDNIVTTYMIQLITSLGIAMLSMYLFYQMLDLLPFIGSGIAGEKNSMPALGTGALSMPGTGIFKKLKDEYAALAGGGK